MKKRMKQAVRNILKGPPVATTAEHWMDVVVPGTSKELDERVALTISCHDADYIPKVKDAGSIKTVKGKQYQLMHNGLLVENSGYYGDWMTGVIKKLKGHHEPQEEKVFYELLQRIPAGGTMIELGAYWSYYSLWFNKAVHDAVNYCCEPDPVNLELGKRNAAINNAQNVTFIQAAAGKAEGDYIDFTPQEGGRPNVHVPIRSIDGIVAEYGIDRLDIVHMDVQGHELTAIEGAEQAIKDGKVRFAIISTHHFCISGDPTLHEKCLDKLQSLGGHVIVEHAIHESFSGDGLIAVSFFEEDRDWSIEVSTARMQDSSFRAYNRDLAVLAEAYEALRQKVQ